MGLKENGSIRENIPVVECPEWYENYKILAMAVIAQAVWDIDEYQRHLERSIKKNKPAGEKLKYRALKAYMWLTIKNKYRASWCDYAIVDVAALEESVRARYGKLMGGMKVDYNCWRDKKDDTRTD